MLALGAADRVLLFCWLSSHFFQEYFEFTQKATDIALKCFHFFAVSLLGPGVISMERSGWKWVGTSNAATCLSSYFHFKFIKLKLQTTQLIVLLFQTSKMQHTACPPRKPFCISSPDKLLSQTLYDIYFIERNVMRSTNFIHSLFSEG